MIFVTSKKAAKLPWREQTSILCILLSVGHIFAICICICILWLRAVYHYLVTFLPFGFVFVFVLAFSDYVHFIISWRHFCGLEWNNLRTSAKKLSQKTNRQPSDSKLGTWHLQPIHPPSPKKEKTTFEGKNLFNPSTPPSPKKYKTKVEGKILFNPSPPHQKRTKIIEEKSMFNPSNLSNTSYL